MNFARSVMLDTQTYLWLRYLTTTAVCVFLSSQLVLCCLCESETVSHLTCGCSALQICFFLT